MKRYDPPAWLEGVEGPDEDCDVLTIAAPGRLHHHHHLTKLKEISL
jgi:hypothetical protein